MYPQQQPGWGPGYQQPQGPQPQPRGIRPLHIVLVACGIAGSCFLSAVAQVSRNRREQDEAVQNTQQMQPVPAPMNGQQYQPQQFPQQPMQVPQVPQQQFPQQQFPQVTQFQPMITSDYTSPENQRLARIAIAATREFTRLTVMDAMVQLRGEPTLVVSTLDAPSPRSEDRAIIICNSLLRTSPELSAITHVIINGESGVRLADGFRHQSRCFGASTSVWDRM